MQAEIEAEDIPNSPSVGSSTSSGASTSTVARRMRDCHTYTKEILLIILTIITAIGTTYGMIKAQS